MPKKASQDSDAMSDASMGEMPSSKSDAVFRVLETFGHDTKPKVIQKKLKDTWGMAMDTKAISTTKHHVLKGPGSKSRLIRKPKGRPPGSGTTAPRTMGAAGITIEDLETVKSLTERVGADTVRRVVEMLAK